MILSRKAASPQSFADSSRIKAVLLSARPSRPAPAPREAQPKNHQPQPFSYRCVNFGFINAGIQKPWRIGSGSQCGDHRYAPVIDALRSDPCVPSAACAAGKAFVDKGKRRLRAVFSINLSSFKYNTSLLSRRTRRASPVFHGAGQRLIRG